MTPETNIGDGNKMIAEFADWKQFSEVRNKKKRYWWSTEGISWEGKEAPSFDTHWELLMPVVEKIAKLGFRVKTNFNHVDNSVIIQSVNNHEDTLSIMYYSTAIDAIYTACIQFIQWYNLTHPTSKQG